jgi:hypothetical protein
MGPITSKPKNMRDKNKVQISSIVQKQMSIKLKIFKNLTISNWSYLGEDEQETCYGILATMLSVC